MKDSESDARMMFCRKKYTEAMPLTVKMNLS